MKESRLGRKYTCIPSPFDKRDFSIEGLFKSYALPEAWDLRPTSPIRDQGNEGACTGFAGSALQDHLWRAHKLIFSPEDLYWNERLLEGTTDQDSGAMIKDCMRALLKFGICLEVDDPYKAGTFMRAPTNKAVSDAMAFRIKSYHRLHTFAEFKTAIYAGSPVDIGFTVYESFESDEVAKTGIVPMPKRGEEKLGGHSVLGIGYKPGYGIFKNSWGTGWGDHGYFYLPEKYFTRSKMSDLWIVQ
jgi:C1A family cysteine protease